MADKVGAARLTLDIDLDTFNSKIITAKGRVKGLDTEIAGVFTAGDAKVRAATVSLAKYAELMGKTPDQAKLLRAAWAGVPTDVLEKFSSQMRAFRNEEEGTIAQTKILSDGFAQMQVRARAAYKELMQGQIDEKLLREANAAKELAKQTELAGIKAMHAAQGVEFLGQKADAERVNRMRQAVSVFGGSLDQLNTAENRSTKAGREFIRMVRDQENSLNSSGRSLAKNTIEFNKYGISAKQNAAALRQVPAQLTDIMVSLQGGQNPLTVFLQQGGQLRDIFGGAVPAVRALAGAVMGLVNPYTLAAGGVAALSYMYIQGEQRANAFARALILSGQAGGDAANDLQAVADRLGEIDGITMGGAAAALTRIASGGKIAYSQFELVAEAAERMRDATGKAMEDTISEYEDLARDPVNAILRLNESEGFLTNSIYERIKALQDAGDIEAAAALATETRAAAQIQRAQDVVDSLGPVATAWHNIKNAIDQSWDSSKNFFGDLDKDAGEAIGTLGRLWNAVKLIPSGGFGFALQGALQPPASPQDKAAAEQQKQVTEAVRRQLDAINDGNRSKEKRQELEETQIINLYRQLGVSKEDARVQKALAESRKRFEESKPKGKDGAAAARSLANAEAAAALDAIKNAEQVTRNEIQNTGKIVQAEYAARNLTVEQYYAQQRALISQDTQAQTKSIQEQIALLRARNVTGKDSVGVNRQLADLESKLAQIRADEATTLRVLSIQEAEVLEKRNQAGLAYEQSLQRANQAALQNNAATVAAIAMGKEEADLRQKMAAIYTDVADKQRELARELSETNDKALYDRKLAALQDYMREQIRITAEGYAQMKAAQADWTNGLTAGVQDWMNEAENVAAQTNRMVSGTLDRIADGMANAAEGADDTWRTLLIDLGKEINRFMMKQAVLGFIKAFAGMWTGGNTDASAGSYTDFVGSANSGFGFAKGGIAPADSNISRYSGTVVSKPTYFAKGGNVMGEAGQEGIFPLQRGRDGKLGVKAMMDGMGGAPQFNFEFNISDSGKSSSASSTDAQSMYRGFAEEMRNVANQVVDRAMMPGGKIWRARGGRM